MNIRQIKENKTGMILKFSIPSIIAMLLQTVITITDGYFTGNYVGQNALAAINLGLPILYFYLGTGLCIGVGGSVISGRLLGANERKKSSEVFCADTTDAADVCIMCAWTKLTDGKASEKPWWYGRWKRCGLRRSTK